MSLIGCGSSKQTYILGFGFNVSIYNTFTYRESTEQLMTNLYLLKFDLVFAMEVSFSYTRMV